MKLLPSQYPSAAEKLTKLFNIFCTFYSALKINILRMSKAFFH